MVDPEAPMMPARDFLDAAEAISWIGYGKALRKSEWWKRLFQLSTSWEFHDELGLKTEDPPEGVPIGNPWNSTAHGLLSTFEARASGSAWPRIPPILTEEGLELADEYMARWEVKDSSGWIALKEQLKSDIERRNLFLGELRVAAGNLRRELCAGTLAAWGCKYRGRSVSSLPRQRLLADEWPPGVEIDFDGRVRENSQIHRVSLTFDTKEVLSIWPPSISRTAVRFHKKGSEMPFSSKGSASDPNDKKVAFEPGSAAVAARVSN